MRIDGGWYIFDDEVTRPVILGEVLARDGIWVRTLFLVDTGADRTVFNATACAKLGFDSSDQREYLGGLGGITESINFETQIRLTRDGGGKPTFRGNNAAVVEEARMIFLINTASIAVNVIAQIRNCISGFFNNAQENLSAVVSKTK